MQRFATQLALGAFVALAAAGTPCLADGTPAALPVVSASALSDVKVARDKETGQLRAATAEESAALDAKAKTIAPSVVQIRRPATTVEFRSDGSAVGKRSLDDMENLLLVTMPDGKKVLQHAEIHSNNAPTVKVEPPTE